MESSTLVMKTVQGKLNEADDDDLVEYIFLHYFHCVNFQIWLFWYSI